MKKFTFLLMFLLASNLLFSQTGSTSRTNCYTDAQVSEIFKGLKQNDYLKMRLEKTETSLANADKVINEQRSAIETQGNIITVKDNLIAGEIAKCAKEKEVLNANIEILSNTIEILKIDHKKDSRRKFWNGVKVGGLSVAVIGGATAAYLILK